MSKFGYILLLMHLNYFNVLTSFYVLVFVYRESIGSKRRNVPFFVHLDFLQSPLQSFILPSYVEALAFALVDLCSIPPSLEPRTRYHVSVEIFIDDETREANV
jgi:hypothetical protein